MDKQEMKRLKGLADFADLSYRIYKETGIHPTDYPAATEYMEAVLSKTATENLAEWNVAEDSKGFDLLVGNELNKRGEI